MILYKMNEIHLFLKHILQSPDLLIGLGEHSLKAHKEYKKF